MKPLPIDVVSVQSQVVYGRVGNNVAVPTLEALGLSVAAVPTVLFSNTPHYPSMHGGPIPIEWFEGYLQDLAARGALRSLRALLVGYLGDPTQALTLLRWAHNLSRAGMNPRIVIDPVLGDHDHGIYVDDRLVQTYSRDLLPMADGLTPNGFELEQLSGLPVHDVESVIKAARSLLSAKTQWIAVTSAAPDTWVPGEMKVILVTHTDTEVITHPRIDAAPKGTGDLFCACLTGHWLNGTSLAKAVFLACQQVVLALSHTQQAQCAELVLSPLVRYPTMADMHM
ncbi:pyridoxine/pyridoxal/pyridoxamine kinase [Paenalcaligenes sp. Me52]|uniref:pyridoxine/pyridoxal/pyridoxamine kinase n=1 Tax=Paenalcaligenes sp. Me52 TaxID=3392038 RepID=UPI003D277A4D